MTTALVVDDESLVRGLLRQILGRLGVTVVEAVDGVDGLDKFKAQAFDLVLCDLIMPRMDGIEAIAGMRRIAPDTPIVAMSGGGRKHAIEILQVAGGMGADHTISKPFTLDQITDLVNRCLARPAERR